MWGCWLLYNFQNQALALKIQSRLLFHTVGKSCRAAESTCDCFAFRLPWETTFLPLSHYEQSYCVISHFKLVISKSFFNATQGAEKKTPS